MKHITVQELIGKIDRCRWVWFKRPDKGAILVSKTTAKSWVRDVADYGAYVRVNDKHKTVLLNCRKSGKRTMAVVL